MSGDPGQLLRQYEMLHNQGIDSGDFAELLKLFLPEGTIQFHGMDFGPLLGIEAIADAFRDNPPSGYLMLGAPVIRPDGLAEADFSWSNDPKQKAGHLFLCMEGGRIQQLDIYMYGPDTTSPNQTAADREWKAGGSY